MSLEDGLGQALHKAHQSLMQITAERDEARAEVERLRFELSLAQRRAEVELDNYDQARAERDALREAARAMVEAAADMAPHCPRCHARVAVTKRCPGPRGGAWFSCDEHATANATDLNHAPALRRLRAMLEAKP